jgi:hypothetical protein
MKIVIAYCAVVTLACCAPAASAPPRTAETPFDGFILRPPASIPHAGATRADAAPLPRPRPTSGARTTPAAPTGPLVFPPVQPLE